MTDGGDLYDGVPFRTNRANGSLLGSAGESERT